MERSAPPFDSILAALTDRSLDVLVLRGDPGEPEDGASASADRRVQLMVRPDQREEAIALAEELPWRYSWARDGLMRLMPMAYYWFDGGVELELYWGLPAAPLPPVALNALADELWRTATPSENGELSAHPAALAVHRAVQACRAVQDHGQDWRLFAESHSVLTDWRQAEEIARRAGVSAAVRRARRAAEQGASSPGPGRLFDGSLLEAAWRFTLATRTHARPRRLRRLLAGAPMLGDATIRCRVGDAESLAGPGVFVPTPDADLILDVALGCIEDRDTPVVVEAGTGCGAIALAVAIARPDAELHATELSPAAVRWARRNARARHSTRMSVYRGSVLSPLPPDLHGRVDLVIANLPFYPSRDYAAIGSVPRGTVQGGGDDGLDLVRDLVRDATALLRPGGSLLLQMFAWQWDAFSPELVAAGYQPIDRRVTGPFVIGRAGLQVAVPAAV